MQRSFDNLPKCDSAFIRQEAGGWLRTHKAEAGCWALTVCTGTAGALSSLLPTLEAAAQCLHTPGPLRCLPSYARGCAGVILLRLVGFVASVLMVYITVAHMLTHHLVSQSAACAGPAGRIVPLVQQLAGCPAYRLPCDIDVCRQNFDPPEGASGRGRGATVGGAAGATPRPALPLYFGEGAASKRELRTANRSGGHPSHRGAAGRVSTAQALRSMHAAVLLLPSHMAGRGVRRQVAVAQPGSRSTFGRTQLVCI
jgi:hypothetical protein